MTRSKLIKVGASVVNQTPLAWESNAENLRRAIRMARNDGVSVLCLPELSISGYGCEDAFHGPFVSETAGEYLEKLIPETQGMIVSFGLPVLHRNGLFNAACMVVDGKIIGFVMKRYLAGDGIHYEPRWFKPWPEGVRTEIDFRGVRYPCGDIHFEVGGVKIGFEICEDAWVATRPGAYLARRAVDVILNPSASHFAFGKLEVRKRFVIEGSRAFGVSYVYANLLGNEAGRAIYDGGPLIAANGSLIAIGPRFSYEDAQVTSGVVDIDVSRMLQVRTASFRPDVTGGMEDCVSVDFTWPDVPLEPHAKAPQSEEWEQSPHLKEEELARAIGLALFDYLRKSRSHGFVISMSGGADSSACACLVSMMVGFGVKELGRDRFLAKLGHMKGLGASPDLMKQLLTCVYQATRNSGEVTRKAAEAVANAVGAEFHHLDVDAVVQAYIGLAGGAIGRPLDWKTDDVTLQNVQARARAPSVWMLANLKNALLVSTSNRSEAAVGYATMDGDTSGGLSPIAGIDKAFLRKWLVWLEKEGPVGLAPIPALSAVNVQAPTAELRPREASQTDEDDLMPYPLLDAIERAGIRDKKSPVEVYERMRIEFPQYTREQLGLWVERFFKLWCRNQWKRERYAPSFHVDDENLDPKTWCRFPILSGGFERELGELRALVAKGG